MAKSGPGNRIKFLKQLHPNLSSGILEEFRRLKTKLNETEDRSAVKIIRRSINVSVKLMAMATSASCDSGKAKNETDTRSNRDDISMYGFNDRSDSGSGQVNDNQKIDEHLNELDVLKEYVWEQFNIGHWKQVPIMWRSLYSFVILLKVVLMASQDAGDCQVCDIIKECDMGLLMGELILDNILSKIAFRLHVEYADDHHQSQSSSSQTQSEIQMQEILTSNQFSDSAKWVLQSQSLLSNQRAEVRMNINLVGKPSIESFIQEHFSPQKPVVLIHAIDHWPAISKWNLEYLRQVAGSRTVPIEVGSKYTSEDWTQKLVTMEHFIDIYIKSRNSDGINENTGGSNKKGYLAQHQLFHQIPELMQDIRIPEYCYVGSSPNIDINAWFGPSGTISPLHYDPKHNLLAQVFGSKIIRLFPSCEWKFLYPHESDSMLFNTSQIDVEDPQLFVHFPNCSNAKYVDVLLEPGMVLYMPPKWGHYVKSLSPSFSVSFWFE